MMVRKGLIAATAVLLAVQAGQADAKKKQMSTLELQQMQSRDLEADKNMVFSSVMTVLQDSGYRIGAADRDTGLITGAASTNTKTTWLPFVGFGRSKKTPVVSAFIEQMTPTVTRVRLNFVMTKVSANGFGGGEDEEPILEPQVYQDAFEKIDQAIFVRQSMAAPAPAPTAQPEAARADAAPPAQ